MQKTWFAGVATAAALVLTGCSGGAATPSSTPSSGAASASAVPSAPVSAVPSAAPSASSATAAGTAIEGTGYRYTVPKGWGEPPSSAATASADSVAADLTDDDGFADNVTVLTVKTGDVPLDQIESAASGQLKSGGAKSVKVRDRKSIAGTDSAHVTAVTPGDTKYRIEQYYLLHDGEGYVITFSFSDDVSQSDRDDVSDPVLASWSWT